METQSQRSMEPPGMQKCAGTQHTGGGGSQNNKKQQQCTVCVCTGTHDTLEFGGGRWGEGEGEVAYPAVLELDLFVGVCTCFFSFFWVEMFSATKIIFLVHSLYNGNT